MDERYFEKRYKEIKKNTIKARLHTRCKSKCGSLKAFSTGSLVVGVITESIKKIPEA